VLAEASLHPEDNSDTHQANLINGCKPAVLKRKKGGHHEGTGRVALAGRITGSSARAPHWLSSDSPSIDPINLFRPRGRESLSLSANPADLARAGVPGMEPPLPTKRSQCPIVRGLRFVHRNPPRLREINPDVRVDGRVLADRERAWCSPPLNVARCKRAAVELQHN
jgi:hypothetical protein